MEASLLITICLMTLIAAATVGFWARNHSARPIVGGIGFLLVPLGLYLTGLTRLTYNGVLSLIAWAQRTVWDTAMTWGAGLLGFGIVLVVVAGFMAAKPRKAVEPKAATSAVASGTSRPAVAGRPATGSPAAAAPQAKPGAKPAVDPEDAEIEALLRKRGIM